MAALLRLPQWQPHALAVASRSGVMLCLRKHSTLYDALEARGLVHNTSAAAQDHLSSPRTIYCGFDPTAASLHVGNLVMIMGLARAAQYGHHVVALVGGATGRIGDPSGRDTERTMLDGATLHSNVQGIEHVLSRVLRNTCNGSIDVVNNASWYEEMNIIEFVSRVGRHFRMGTMLAKDSVRTRLGSEEGMSFTEFTYQLFQAYDFAHLFATRNCSVQLGGSDQWGNLTAGTELIRKLHGGQGYGITLPLLTTSTGEKFGKSAGNAVWLSEDMTSSYDLYQFFVNVADADVELYLKALTLLPLERIDEIITQHQQHPDGRHAQHQLAKEIVAIVHGQTGLARAQNATSLLHGGADLQSLAAEDIRAVVNNVPVLKQPQSQLGQIRAIDLLSAPTLGLFASKAEVRRTIKMGGVKINDTRLDDANHVVSREDLVGGNEFTVVKKGKKHMALIHWT